MASHAWTAVAPSGGVCGPPLAPPLDDVVVALELLLDELVEALEPPEPVAEPELHAAASPATIVSGTPHPKILVEKAIIRSSET
jgi:hypothetical protein